MDFKSSKLETFISNLYIIVLIMINFINWMFISFDFIY